MSIPGKLLIALLSALVVAAAASALQPQLALLDLFLPSAVSAVLAVVLSHRALPVPEALESDPASARPAQKPAASGKKSKEGRDKPRERKRKPKAEVPHKDRKTDKARKPEAAARGGDLEEGTVKWFNVTKGYGFIIRASGEEIFVHHRSVLGEGRGRLDDGARVRFRVVDTDKGPQAEDVEAL